MSTRGGGDSIQLESLLPGVVNSNLSFAQEVWTLFDTWKGFKSDAENRWAETKRYVFATDTKNSENSSNPWFNTTVRPKLANIYDNLIINYDATLFPNDDWLRFVGEDKDSVLVSKRNTLNSYMKTKHRLSNFRGVVKELLTDWVLYGNCFAGVTYKTDTAENQITGEVTPNYVGPHVYRIDPMDIVFNAIATDFQHSPKIIRSFKTLAELHRDVEENPELGYQKELITAIGDFRTSVREATTQTDGIKDFTFRGDGFGSINDYHFDTPFIEIREFYGDIYDNASKKWLKNHVITIADGIFVLRSQPLDTWTGRPNIFHLPWRKIPGNLWGQGPLDNIVGMQYRMNHLENARADAFDQMLDPDLVFKGDVEVEQVGAAKHYYVAEAGDVRDKTPDTTVLNADFQIKELESMMELFAGTPREALGVRTPGEKTAFEVQQLGNAASRTFEHKTEAFSLFLEEIANAEIEVARRNLNTADIIKIVDDEIGIEEFLAITKDDIMATGQFIAVGARHSSRQSQLTQTLTQLHQMLLSDPELLQHFSSLEMAKMYTELLEHSDTKLFSPYIRIQERLDAQRRMQIAQEQLQEETQIGLDDQLGEDESFEEEVL